MITVITVFPVATNRLLLRSKKCILNIPIYRVKELTMIYKAHAIGMDNRLIDVTNRFSSSICCGGATYLYKSQISTIDVCLYLLRRSNLFVEM